MIAVLVTVVLVICLCVPLARTVRSDMRDDATQSIRRSVLATAVQCYSVEGVYPSDLSYLEDHYGLQINHDEYIVTYDLVASNLPPDVTVLVRGQS